MTTKRKTISKAKYQQLTDKQLVTLIRKWHKRHASLAKTPEWKTTQGWTPKEQRACLQRELRTVAAVLRFKSLKNLDKKILELKTQLAKRYGVTINSPAATSAAIKRLQAKRRQVSATQNHLTLATILAALKLSSYKNPSFTGITKTTRTIGKTARGTTYLRTTKTTALNATHKKKIKSLKKEIQKLKQRNSFMRNQVAKFRKEVTQLQGHYGNLRNTAPRLSLVSNKKVGQDVSNIIRFSNALSTALSKQQRRTG